METRGLASQPKSPSAHSQVQILSLKEVGCPMLTPQAACEVIGLADPSFPTQVRRSLLVPLALSLMASLKGSCAPLAGRGDWSPSGESLLGPTYLESAVRPASLAASKPSPTHTNNLLAAGQRLKPSLACSALPQAGTPSPANQPGGSDNGCLTQGTVTRGQPPPSSRKLRP